MNNWRLSTVTWGMARLCQTGREMLRTSLTGWSSRRTQAVVQGTRARSNNKNRSQATKMGLKKSTPTWYRFTNSTSTSTPHTWSTCSTNTKRAWQSTLLTTTTRLISPMATMKTKCRKVRWTLSRRLKPKVASVWWVRRSSTMRRWMRMTLSIE